MPALGVATETDFFGPDRKLRPTDGPVELVYVDRYFRSYVECTGSCSILRVGQTTPVGPNGLVKVSQKVETDRPTEHFFNFGRNP